MAITTSAALRCVASSSLAIGNSQITSSQKNMEATSSSVFRSRAAIGSSSILGERVSCSPSSSVSNRSRGQPRALLARRGAARCFQEPCPDSRTRNTSGRIIFTPFGPVFTPNSGRGSNARREWEKRNRFQEERIRAQREMMKAQQARFRDMIEGQLRNSAQDRDMALLRELERRLRAEAGSQESSTKQSDIDELMKNLEKRLRPKKESNENSATETQKTGREQQYSTVYDYLNAWLKEWDQGMKEERSRLQKQWEEANTAQQPRQSSEPDVKTEDPSSALKEQDQVYTPEELDTKTEDSSSTLREQDQVHTPELNMKTEDSSSTLEKQDQVHTPELNMKTEDSSSTLEKQDQVYSPEELQKAEEEEKKKLLVEEENKKAAAEAVKQVESKTAEAPNSKNAPSDGTVIYLKNEANGAELYLVGTSHVSQQSADEVRDVIRKVHPNYVMVELDRKRYNSMVQRQRGRDNPFAFLQQMMETLTNGNIGAAGKVMGLGLSGFYRLLASRGVQAGQEFRVAIEEGKGVGAKVVLGDQDIDVTLKHFGEQMSMADAFNFFAQPMPSDIVQKMSGASPGAQGQMFEQLRDRKLARRLNEEMATRAPAFTNILLGERNEAMTKALRNLSGKVVGVVGLAHLDGIEQLWREANEKYLTETE